MITVTRVQFRDPVNFAGKAFPSIDIGTDKAKGKDNVWSAKIVDGGVHVTHPDGKGGVMFVPYANILSIAFLPDETKAAKK